MQPNLNFGLFKTDFIYQDTSSLRTSSSLKDLVIEKSSWQWNSDFITLYCQGKDTWPLSPVVGIEKITHPNLAPDDTHLDFLKVLNLYFSKEKSSTINLALSGGLDSQVLALYAQELGFQVKAFYLESKIEVYCESEQVRKFCDHHAIDCHRIETNYTDFTTSLPEFLTKAECPIYNLHPVSKWILAREVSKLGVTQIYSGDGADQSFAGSEFCDLFFLTKNCFEHFNVELITPFANWPLLSWATENGPFLNKEPLRTWALEKWQIGTENKKSNYFPDKQYGIDSFQESILQLERSLCAP